MADCHVLPKTIVTDNAAQFRKIEDSSPNFWTSIPTTHPFKNEMFKHSIEWKFIQAKVLWFGGVYERLTRPVKTILYNILDHSTHHRSELITALKHTQTIVNKRPLHAVYKDANYERLTPEHFFTPTTILTIPIQGELGSGNGHSSAHSAAEKLVEFRHKAKHYYNKLWEHWRKHYLLQLGDIPRYDLRNHKSTRPMNIVPGDILHVLGKNTKTDDYSLAGVTELHKSHDGQVRSVSLILPNKTLTNRPLSQIAPLELHTNTALLLRPRKTVAKLKKEHLSLACYARLTRNPTEWPQGVHISL